MTEPIQKVLKTLPEETEVPKAVVMFGILTEQLQPVDGDLNKQIQIVSKNIADVPPASVPDQTIDGIEWLLYQLRETLSPTRKQQIGQLLQQSGLAGETNRSETNAGTEEQSVNSSSDGAAAETEQTTDEADRTNHSDEERSETASSDDETVSQESTTQSKYSTTAENGLAESTNTAATEESATHQCEFCEESFPSQSTLVSHTVQCDQRPDDAKYTCPACGNEYVSETALQNHRDDCNQNQSTTSADDGTSASHTCAHCGSEFDELQNWMEHEQACQESHSSSKSSGRLSEKDTTPGQLIAEGITGHVSDYNPDKGYGFILTFNLSNPDQSNSIFFHVSDYPGTPQASAKLSFDVRETDDGLKAEAISREKSTIPEPEDKTFASERTTWGE